MKALVVDDVAHSRIIVQKVLEQAGMEVFSAASGTDAPTKKEHSP
jgi:CheY-like chemotaxis protein